MKFMALTVLTLSILTGCASRREQTKIDKKVTQETTVSDGKTLGVTVHDVIAQSTTLTEKQKQELGKILEGTKVKSKALSEESFKLRAVLIKELLAEAPNAWQVRLLKKDIKKAEAQRLQVTFDAIAQISRIVAKDPQIDVFMDHMLTIEHLSH